MGYKFTGNTATCTHDITYQFTCQKCGTSVGPLVKQFAGEAAVKPDSSVRLTDLDVSILIDLASIRAVWEIAKVYSNAKTKSKDAFAPHIFDNHCPGCLKYQDWTTVRGVFRRKPVENLSGKLLPVIDWRLEQLSPEMYELFEIAIRGNGGAQDELVTRQFLTLKPGALAELIQVALGETSFEAVPFQTMRHNDAPDLRRDERAYGYFVDLKLRWFVVKEKMIDRII